MKKWKLVQVLIFIVSIVCAAGMMMMLCNLYQQMTANAAVIDEIKEMVAQMSVDPAKEEKFGLMVDYMGKLQDIQSRSLSNDVMSFIYGILSTVLIVVCAGYVAKCDVSATAAKEKAEAAADSAKDAEEKAKTATKSAAAAEKKAEAAADSAKDAEEKAKTATKSAAAADQKARTAADSAEIADQKAQSAEKSAVEVSEVKADLERENRRTQNSVKLLQIHPAISEAKLALSIPNMVLAHDCCHERILKNVNELAIKSSSDPLDFDKASVEQLIKELKLLREQMKKFKRDRVRQIENGKKNSSLSPKKENDLYSKSQAASNCEQWITEAIDGCNTILKQINSAA